MSRRLPALDARDVLKALHRAGFFVARSSGSHQYLIHEDDPSRRVVVPVHGGRDLPRGLLRAIVRQSGLSVEEFIDLL
ncbi:MAG: type II toxin-antitoxin system HicA family toxin [Kiloniellales bacterium]